MKVLQLILLLIPLSISQVSIAQEFKQFFYANGKVSSEGYLKDGKPDGYWKSYYENGNIKSIGKRTNTMLDSIWCFYDEQGFLEKEISYFENHKNGFYKEFAHIDSTTYLKMNVLYVTDQKQGIEQYFSPDGHLFKEIPYVNNKKEGKGYEYSLDNTVITISIYENDQNISNQSINRTNSAGEKIGTHITFYPNGAMKTEAYYANGKLNGVYKLYNQHEQVVQIGNYENDSLLYASSTIAEFDDPLEKKTYYPDSTIKSKGSFRGKVPIGVHREYDKKGNLISSRLYDTTGTLLGIGIVLENGDKDGNWTFFYPSQQKESEGQFVHGQKEGLWTFYYFDGTVKQTGYYAKGKYSGLWKFYNSAGDIQKEEEYANGERNGLSKEYDDEGEKILEGMYKNDLRQGFWTDKTGDLISEGNYNTGEKHGIWKSSYRNGNKAFKGEYFLGKQTGKHIYFYKNGQIEHDEQWRQGKAVKTWNYYNEKGNLLYSIYYKDGIEKRVTTNTK